VHSAATIPPDAASAILADLGSTWAMPENAFAYVVGETALAGMRADHRLYVEVITT
jgi:hypothetical protein